MVTNFVIVAVASLVIFVNYSVAQQQTCAASSCEEWKTIFGQREVSFFIFNELID
jgi:hypothetical protein